MQVPGKPGCGMSSSKEGSGNHCRTRFWDRWALGLARFREEGFENPVSGTRSEQGLPVHWVSEGNCSAFFANFIM